MTFPRRKNASARREAMATVTACHYDFGAGQALAFGIPKTKHFQISFNYWAEGELHTGEFASSKAIPQGTLFPITYDPEAPNEHRYHAHAETSHSVAAFGIIGFLVLLTTSVLLMRACS